MDTPLAEVVENRPRRASDLLDLTNDPARQRLAREPAKTYEYSNVGPGHIVFLLNRPRR